MGLEGGDFQSSFHNLHEITFSEAMIFTERDLFDPTRAIRGDGVTSITDAIDEANIGIGAEKIGEKQFQKLREVALGRTPIIFTDNEALKQKALAAGIIAISSADLESKLRKEVFENKGTAQILPPGLEGIPEAVVIFNNLVVEKQLRAQAAQADQREKHLHEQMLARKQQASGLEPSKDEIEPPVKLELETDEQQDKKKFKPKYKSVNMPGDLFDYSTPTDGQEESN